MNSKKSVGAKLQLVPGRCAVWELYSAGAYEIWIGVQSGPSPGSQKFSCPWNV